MNISEFTFKVLLIALPGLVAFIIIDRFTTHREPKLHHWIVYTYLLGVLSYAGWSLLVELLSQTSCLTGFKPSSAYMNVESLFAISSSGPPYRVILGTTVIVAPLFGFLLTRAINYKWMTTIVRWAKVSNKYEEMDLWQHVLNMSDKELSRWVVIRDYERDLMYEGFIEAYADSTETMAVFLRYVRVYRESRQNEAPQKEVKLSEGTTTNEVEAVMYYEVNSMYLPLNLNHMVIEFPQELEGGNA